jgi:hypothetical protein
MATPWSSSKTTRKLNLQPISNIELFPAHVELELGMLGVAGKLVKDVIHLWSQKFWNFFSYKLPQTASNHLWDSIFF